MELIFKRCAEIWLNLTDIGYECLFPNENMENSLSEYHEIVKANSLKYVMEETEQH